ncbi:hypothetical protein BDD12DRAFT_880767 [Trichophaea hybrida]|nr:hypothetical protein BDD12DRAFT_880767 [Trichophaea hybrida]
MVVTQQEEGAGNDIESQALRNGTMNNVSEDLLADLINNKNFQKQNMEKSYRMLGITMDNRALVPLKTTPLLHPHHIVGVNWIAEMENGLEHGELLAEDCGTSKTQTALALICHQVNKYEQLRKQPPPGLELWQLKIDNIKVQEEKGQNVEKAQFKPCLDVHLPILIFCPITVEPEWNNAMKIYSELNVNFHYGSEYWTGHDHHEAMKCSHP